MRPTCTESTFRPISRPASRRIEATQGERGDRDDADPFTGACSRRRTHCRPVRRLGCPSDTQARRDHPVHPGAVAQQVLSDPRCGRADLLRRPRLRARLRDAHRRISARRRVPRQRPGHGVPSADHGSRFRHRHSRTRRVSGPHPRGAARDVGRLERLAGPPLAGQPQQLARAVARFDLRRHRGAGSESLARSRSGPDIPTWRRS